MQSFACLTTLHGETLSGIPTAPRYRRRPASFLPGEDWTHYALNRDQTTGPEPYPSIDMSSAFPVNSNRNQGSNRTEKKGPQFIASG